MKTILITSRKVSGVQREQARKDDHICYFSGLRKLRTHFSKWRISFNLNQILGEVIQAEEKQLGTAQKT